MTWFMVDDGFHAHPKNIGLSFAAIGLWTKCGSWCADQLTDGFLPEKLLKAWSAPPEAVAELVESGLWEAVPLKGYQFHDWHDYQPSRAKVLDKRRKDAERKARGNASESRGTPRGVVADSGRPSPSPSPIPTQPEEKRQQPQNASAAALAGRMWWRECVGRDDYDHRASKTRTIFEAFADKPDVERVAVAAVLQAERSKIGVMKFLTPDHVLAYWPSYVTNNPPGRKRSGMTQQDPEGLAADAAGGIAPWAI